MKNFIKKIIVFLLKKRKIEKDIGRGQLFIIGTGRSGTSMFRTELWSKFEILSPPENFALLRIIFLTEILFFRLFLNLKIAFIFYINI